MTQRSLEILEKALALTEEERAQIAVSLVQSLDDTVDEDAESTWQQEIANRAAELDSGRAKTVPWVTCNDEILATLRAALRNKSGDLLVASDADNAQCWYYRGISPGCLMPRPVVFLLQILQPAHVIAQHRPVPLR
jgi:putative addiction module component (TIGR02574 family)